jgi:outer membrane protein assembly factor BamB
VKCRDGLTGNALLSSIPEDGPVGQALAARSDWPHGNIRTELSDEEALGLASHSRLYRLDILSTDNLLLPGVRASLDPAQARISVRDGIGREMIDLELSRRSGTSFYSSNYGLTRGRFYGHLLVLSMGFEVVGLDTLKVSRNAAKREIWQQDLSQSVPGAPQARKYVRPIAVNNPWCGPIYVPRDQQGNPVGMLGPLSDRGLTFLRERTLVCIDPIKGEDIWSRNDCVAGSSLFGDQEYIVVIPPNSNQVRVFRASDGDEVHTGTVPSEERRWSTFGRKILTWDDSPGKMVLRLYDPLTDSDAWAFDFLVGSKGWIIDDAEVAVLEPSGNFVIIRMADGTRAVEVQLEQQPSLTGIYVLASESTYVLVTNTPITQTEPNLHISPAPGGFFSPLVNGQAYAFDRQSGASLWPQPVGLDQYGLPLQQSSELPVVVFLRQIRKTDRGRSAGIVTSVLCVDKRTGDILYGNDDIPTQTRAFEVVGDIQTGKVSVMLPARTINIQFAEKGANPEATPQGDGKTDSSPQPPPPGDEKTDEADSAGPPPDTANEPAPAPPP